VADKALGLGRGSQADRKDDGGCADQRRQADPVRLQYDQSEAPRKRQAAAKLPQQRTQHPTARCSAGHISHTAAKAIASSLSGMKFLLSAILLLALNPMDRHFAVIFIPFDQISHQNSGQSYNHEQDGKADVKPRVTAHTGLHHVAENKVQGTFAFSL
jgi:hypothetical protein